MIRFRSPLSVVVLHALMLSIGVTFNPLIANHPVQENEDPATAFVNARVFDGNRIIEKTTVLIDEGRIIAVGTDTEVPASAKVIDCAGKTLLPGLIDTHVHAYFKTHLEQAAMFGVTTELDMMSSPRMVAVFRAQQKANEANDRADLFSAGYAVTVKNGHGTQFGLPVPTLDSAEGAAAFVNERIREGADYIKIIYEDGKAFGRTIPTINRKMLENSIQAAKAGKKLAVAHIGSQPLASDAVEFGINGLVHLFAESKIAPELVDSIKSQGIFVTPTIAVVSNIEGESTSPDFIKDSATRALLTNTNLSNMARAFPKSPDSTNSLENLLHNVNALHEAGVVILAGTDAPNPGTAHGASMHHELDLLVRAGMEPIEALRAATSAPAKAYGLDDRGVIAKGKRADLFLVEGDPTKDIKQTRKIVEVYKNGYLINRQNRIDQVLAEKKAATESKPGATESKLVSDFEDGLETGFGAGWMASTDSMMGGSSTAKFEVVDGGANSDTALVVKGNIREQNPRFAGIMFSPGAGPMQKTNLSDYGSISFYSKSPKGEQNLSVMLFFSKRGFQPSSQTFQATEKWTRHSFKIDSFDGCDGSDITALWFGADQPGDYTFMIDSVSFDP